jgi:hypothetical protein
MGSSEIDPIPTDGPADQRGGGGQHDRQEWVRANFTQIFGTSAADLQAQGIDPRRYAREHRDQIRQFAQGQRRQGIAVPSGRPPVDPGPADGEPAGRGSAGRGPRYRPAGGFGMGMWGGGAGIGILVVLLVLRFVLVGSLVGAHAAIVWVLVIGGIVLVARVFLFSWLRRRRLSRRQSGGRPPGRSGF